MNAVRAALYAVGLATALASAGPSDIDGTGHPARRSRRPATITALMLVGLPTLLQLTVAPFLLQDLRRDWAAIAHGQVWRLATSLVVQDGGVPGAVFNLVSLAVVGTVSERVWGPRRWTVVALGAGLGAQLWGRVVQPVGAGNSVAVFGLAAALAVVALRRGSRAQQVAGALSLVAAGVLLVFGDIHGGAAAMGAVLGWVLSRSGSRTGADGG